MDANDDLMKELEAILYSFKDIDPIYLEPCETVNDISIPNSDPETIASNLIGASYEGIYFDFDDFESEKLHSVPAGLPEGCFVLYDDPRSSSEIVSFENLCEYDTNDDETEKPREGPFEAASKPKLRRKYFTKKEKSLLESCFLEDPDPPFKIRKLIADAFGTKETKIETWFHKTRLKRKIKSRRKKISRSNKTEKQPDPDGCSFVKNIGNDYLQAGGTIWKDISTDSRPSQYNLGPVIHRTFQFSDDTLSYHSRLHLHGSTLQEANIGNSNPVIQGEMQVPEWRQKLAEMGKETYYDIAQNSNFDSSWDIVDENFDPCNNI